ncbi:pyridoxal phosphate-dependent aminotransferase [Candidatus Nitrosocosmicus franklandus]|uniref:Aminotransferase n=1 Tax=Candidatus Nitrosocosmicus franklandianus TaxID=1798806 RepID=A0A484IED5_9ARCH|nr:histidinol-phosphate transaminase [Candidatus Nitrosocosmicus franklandus]VFJ13334.1 Aminotransferase [Candidatus Nitrosocosmicus franklandus]
MNNKENIFYSNFHDCRHGGFYSVNWPKNRIQIDFSSNLNPFGISSKVLSKLRNNIALAYNYPDPKCIDLKKKILDYIGSEKDFDINHNLIIGNGATELIHYFAYTFVRNKALIPVPTFCEYELASRNKVSAAIHYSYLREDNFIIDSDSIIRTANNPENEISSLFLCNPNNPTGKFYEREVTEIIEKIDKKIKILLDESFIEFVDSKKKSSNNHFVDLVKEYENLTILRSLTKTFGLAGLRIGYAISTKANIDKLSQHLISWNVNGLAQIAGIEALKDKKHLKSVISNNNSERTRLFSLYSKNAKIRAIPTDTNFFMIKILDSKINSTALRDKLLRESKILVRDCKDFTGLNDKFIRVAIKTRKENDTLVRSLEAAL